jgi:anti-sigma factor RsiW
MPSCDSIDSVVTPYVDGELSAADRQMIEQHLGACAACRGRVARERAMRALIAERRTSLCGRLAPPLLRARVAGLAAHEKAGTATGRADRAASWRRPRVASLAAAAVLLLVVGGAVLFEATVRSARVMAAELTMDHVKCFKMNGLVGVRHFHKDDVERQMATRFDWKMTLPQDPAQHGLELVGSRPCLYGEGKTAHIMYRHNGTPLSLFMLPRSERSPQTLEMLGHAAAIWSDAERTFVLVSREAPEEVEKVAAVLQTSLR